MLLPEDHTELLKDQDYSLSLSKNFGRAQIKPSYPGATLPSEQTQLHSRLTFSEIS